MSTPSQEAKAAAFEALHLGPPFVMPNPWDGGSARVLAAHGFEALATTSSGFAFTLGRLDGHLTLDGVAQHTALLDQAVDLPISVDLERAGGIGEASHPRCGFLRMHWPIGTPACSAVLVRAAQGGR